jgi:hypothetical protein
MCGHSGQGRVCVVPGHVNVLLPSYNAHLLHSTCVGLSVLLLLVVLLLLPLQAGQC